MDKYAIIEHFDKIAHNNRQLISGEIKGILLTFRGHGYTLNPQLDTCSYEACAERGIMLIFPQYNPWCWMNKKTVDYIDAIIDAAIEMNNLSEDIPVGIYGGSMGGYCAFHYAIKAKRKISAVATNCPCTNLEYECSNNSLSVTRTYFESSLEDTDSFREHLHQNNPLNMVDRLPNIPYRVSVGLKDELLSPALHAIPMVEKMKAAGLDVVRVDYPEMAHCNYSNEDRIKEHMWVIDKILDK